MAQPHQGLPPLEWIRVFEAAARLGSFTAAGQEIGLTQAAVSQRIRHLELRLGAQLFTRQARGVILSTPGEAWLPQVQAAFALLGHSVANQFASPRRKVTLAASASVIELWIVPRLAETAYRLPHVQIVFETVHNLPDYERSDADLEIHFGDGRWLGRDARRLFQEELVPVALPTLLGPDGAGDWRTLPRIATSGPRLGWQDWSKAMGEPPPPPPLLRFDTFAQALSAAHAGAGVLLASLPLSQAAIDGRRLLRLTDRTLRMNDGYWITWAMKQPEFAERRTLVECLSTPWRI